MKKIFHTGLCLSFVLSSLPTGVLASQTYVTPPIYVSVLKLNEEVQQIKKDVLNQERSDRDDELLARQLAQDNAALISDIQKSQPNALRQPGDLVTFMEVTTKLRFLMEEYGRKLDERNKAMIERNEQLGLLKARIDKLEHLFDEVIKLSKNVEQTKNPAVDNNKETIELKASLENQKLTLLEKDKALKLKDDELNQYIKQLQETKEELLKLQTASKQINASTSTQEKELVSIKASLEAKADQLSQLQNSIGQKDSRIKELEGILLEKDQQVAQLKNQIAQVKEELVSKDKEVQAIKGELSSTQEQVVNKDQLLKEQQQTIDSLRQEVAGVKQNIETLRVSNQEDTEGFDKIRANIITLKDKLAQAEKKAVNADQQEADLIKFKGDIAVLTTQLQHSQEDLSDYKAHVNQLNTTIDQLNAQIASKDQTIKDLSAQVTNKEQDLTTKSAAINQLQEQVKVVVSYKEQVKDLKANIASLQEEVNALKTQVSSFNDMKERAHLQEVLLSKFAEMEKLLVEKSSLLSQLASVNDRESEYYRDQLKKTIIYWQELNQNNTSQVESINQQAKDQQKLVDSLSAQLKESKLKAAQFESMLDVYQHRADDKEEQLKEKIVYIDQLQGDLQTTQEHIDQRDNDLQKVRNYFFELEKKSAEKSKELRDKNQQLALFSASLDNQKGHVAQLKEMIIKLQQKLKAPADLNGVEGQRQYIESLQEQLKTLQGQHKGMINPTDFQKQQEELALVKEKLRISENRLEAMIKEKESIARQKQLMQENLAVAEFKLRNVTDNGEFNKQTKALKDLQERLTVAEARIKTSVDASVLQQTKQLLKAASDELAALKLSLKEKDKQIDQLKSDGVKSNDLQNQINQAKAKIAKIMEDSYYKDKQIERLNMQMAAKDQSTKALSYLLTKTDQRLKESQNNGDLTNLKTSIQNTQKQLIDFRNEIKRKQETIELLEKDKSSYANLRLQLTKAQQDLQGAQKALSTKDKTLIELSNELLKRKQAKIKPTTTLEKYQQELDTLKDQLKNALNEAVEARKTAADKNKQSKELADQVNGLKHQIENLKDKIASLEKSK